MSVWSSPLTGVVIGGVIASATSVITQLLSTRKEDKRLTAAARAQAEAEWVSLQIRTIVEVQELIEKVGTAAEYGYEDEDAVQLAAARLKMLSVRLADQAVAAQVRRWASDKSRDLYARGATPRGTHILGGRRPAPGPDALRSSLEVSLGQLLVAHHAVR